MCVRTICSLSILLDRDTSLLSDKYILCDVYIIISLVYNIIEKERDERQWN